MSALPTTTVTPVPELKNDKFVAREQLSAADLKVAKSLAAQWLKDNLDVLGIVHVGDRELSFAATAGRKLLDGVRTNEYEEASVLVTNVLKQVREVKQKRPQVDPDFLAKLQKGKGFLEKIVGRFGVLKSGIQAYLDRSRELAKNFDIIKADGLKMLGVMEDGVTNMDAMLDENIGWTKKALMATAALEFLQDQYADQIEKADTLWPAPEDRKNAVADLEQKVALIDKKLGDLKPRIYASNGTSVEFRSSISADSVNAMAFNSFVTTGIGAFIEQIALIVNKYRLDEGRQLYDVLQKGLNEAYVEGADAVKETAEIEADMLRKTLIDVETLDKITDAIVEAGEVRKQAMTDAAKLHDDTEVAIKRNMAKLEAMNKDLEKQAVAIARRNKN